MKLIKSYLELHVFIVESKRMPDIKYSGVIKKQIKVFSKLLDGHNDSVEDSRIEFCCENPDRTLKRDEKGKYLTDRVGELALKARIKELLSKTVTVDLFIKYEDLLLNKSLIPKELFEYYLEFIGHNVEEIDNTLVFSVETTEESRSEVLSMISTFASSNNLKVITSESNNAKDVI